MACDRLQRVCRCRPNHCTCGMITLGSRNPTDAVKDDADATAVDVVPFTDTGDPKAQIHDSPKRAAHEPGAAKVKFKQDLPKNKLRQVAHQGDEAKRSLKPPANQAPAEKSKGAGSRVTFFETPTLHVLQPHSHKRHFPHHLLDHFSSAELLRRTEKRRPQRQKWQELTPVSTSCEYKDSNFLSEGPASQLIVVKQQLQPTLSMSDGEALPTTKTHPPLKSTVWRRTPALYGDRKPQPSNTRQYYSFKYEGVDGPYSDGKYHQRKREAGRAPQSGGISGKSRPPQASKYAPYLGKHAAKGGGVAEVDGAALLHGGGMQKTKLRRTKSLKPDSGTYLHTRAVQTELSSFDQLGLQHQASQTDPKRRGCALEDLFQFDKSSEALSESSVSSSSFVDSSIASSPTEEYADEDDKSSFAEEYPSADLTPNSYFRFQLQTRSKHIHNKLRRMREHLSTQHKPRIDVTNATMTLLNELEQVVFEAYELYDDFECDLNGEADKIQELRRELQATKRNCRILEYELMRTDVNTADAERISELEEETKLCRHVAVSLHWELQAADEKLQKTESRNTDLHERLASAEVEKSIYEKEALSLRNMVDQMSLHASSVPAEPEPTLGSRETIPELQRQVRFYDEERKAVLSRLVEVEKERDTIQEQNENYRRIYGEILLPLRSLESEEWRTKDLKIRIRMAEDQAGVLGRRVMQLEIDNGCLMKQVEEWESANAEQSRKATTSDIQFLEDEVEALRLALQDGEQENLVLRDQISQMNRMAKEREKMLMLETPKVEEKIALKSPLLERALATPNDAEQPWSLPDNKTNHVNRSDSEMTLSALNQSDLDKFSMRVMTHIRTAIDAETQTVQNMQVSDVIERILGGQELHKAPGISRELIDVLARSKEADVEHVVAQLHNLAVATRSLLGDGDVADIRRVVSEDKATQKSDEGLVHCRVVKEETHVKPRVEVVTVVERVPPEKRLISISQLLVLALLSYVTATSLPLATLFKLAFLALLFFAF